MTATIQDAYGACAEELHRLDMARCAAVLGLECEGHTLKIPFFDQLYRVSIGQIQDRDGEKPTDAVGLVLCRYLLNCPSEPLPQGRQLTFRELDGAGPLVSSFATNTNKLITSAFAGDARALEAAGARMQGKKREDTPGFDLVMAFNALPHVSLILQFNAADDLFPAQCSMLFDQSAQGYLDMQTLFISGTYLAGGLVRHSKTDDSA